MEIVIGNLWDDPAKVKLVSANSFVRKDGTLVMGRGAAAELKAREPDIDLVFGLMIEAQKCAYPAQQSYGVIWTKVGDMYYGAFQVKHHWKDAANLFLIQKACHVLVNNIEDFKWKRVAMNYPGIGNGRLREEDVIVYLEDLLEDYPVVIYKRPA